MAFVKPFGIARKYPHDIVEFHPESHQFVARSSPYRSINYSDYGANFTGERRIAYDDPYEVSKRARSKVETLIIRGSPGFSRWNPRTERYD